MSYTLLSGDVITFSAIYAKCTRVGRRPLWHALEQISTNVSGLWLLAGNFNIISSAYERFGGSHANMEAMGDFNSAIFNCSLGDVEFDGPPFTRTNRRVWQCLDRALMNQQWSSVFGITKVSHMPRGRLDHAPLLIKCGNHSTFPTSFQFLNIWRKHKGFLDIVKEAREIPVRGVGMESFYQKLQNVKYWLREWNMKYFGRIESKVKKALELLQVRQSEFGSQNSITNGMNSPKLS
ncbi:uncharacterized protein [Coffea arabica]|uniref:Endonuclease/exonuclease/phosphatase domain-containing protein n=1 Tax=Coffea arabica TaxID=13443 RepID=A0ABM4WM46_COFAR